MSDTPNKPAPELSQDKRDTLRDEAKRMAQPAQDRIDTLREDVNRMERQDQGLEDQEEADRLATEILDVGQDENGYLTFNDSLLPNTRDLNVLGANGILVDKFPEVQIFLGELPLAVLAVAQVWNGMFDDPDDKADELDRKRQVREDYFNQEFVNVEDPARNEIKQLMQVVHQNVRMISTIRDVVARMTLISKGHEDHFQNIDETLLHNRENINRLKEVVLDERHGYDALWGQVRHFHKQNKEYDHQVRENTRLTRDNYLSVKNVEKELKAKIEDMPMSSSTAGLPKLAPMKNCTVAQFDKFKNSAIHLKKMYKWTDQMAKSNLWASLEEDAYKMLRSHDVAEGETMEKLLEAWENVINPTVRKTFCRQALYTYKMNPKKQQTYVEYVAYMKNLYEEKEKLEDGEARSAETSGELINLILEGLDNLELKMNVKRLMLADPAPTLTKLINWITQENNLNRPFFTRDNGGFVQGGKPYNSVNSLTEQANQQAMEVEDNVNALMDGNKRFCEFHNSTTHWTKDCWSNKKNDSSPYPMTRNQPTIDRSTYQEEQKLMGRRNGRGRGAGGKAGRNNYTRAQQKFFEKKNKEKADNTSKIASMKNEETETTGKNNN